MKPLQACRLIEAFSAGWDEDGSLGPREPYSWESIARMSMDYAKAAIRDAVEPKPGCKYCGMSECAEEHQTALDCVDALKQALELQKTAECESCIRLLIERDLLRQTVIAMLDLFGKPHPEEYVDGGASYQLAVATVAAARKAIRPQLTSTVGVSRE